MPMTEPTSTPKRPPVDFFLGLDYTFHVIASPDGGYVVRFPDLPGCLSQTDNLDDVPSLANEVRQLWIEAEYEAGRAIPLPTLAPEYSGKFNLRIPRSLHRKLVESAADDGVSLNQYVTMLLAQGDTEARVARRADDWGEAAGQPRHVAESPVPYDSER